MENVSVALEVTRRVVSVRKIPEDKWSFSPDPQNPWSDPRVRKLPYMV